MNEEKIKISVIIPVYNVKDYLGVCLDSILQQSYSNLEVICVDDGSTDSSSCLLDQYATDDDRVVVIHKANAGVSAARNDGIARATGDYCFFADSDDWMLPGAFKALAEFVVSNPVDVLISDHVVSDGCRDREVRMFSNPFVTDNQDYINDIQAAVYNMGPAYYKNSLFEIYAGSAAPWHHLIRRDLIINNHLRYEPALRGLFDDGLFTLNVLECAGSVGYVPVCTYAYREVQSSLTQGYNDKIQEKYPAVFSALSLFNSKSRNKLLDKTYPIRVYSYLNKAVDANYLHPLNPRPESERYECFMKLAISEPFASELRKVPTEHLGLKKSRILARTIKEGHFKWYWVLKKIVHARAH